MGFPFPVYGAGAVPDGTPPQPAAPTPGLGGRADYGAQQAPVAEQAHAGFDPPAITNRTNFASWDHGALKSAADTLNSGSMSELASAWIDRGQYRRRHARCRPGDQSSHSGQMVGQRGRGGHGREYGVCGAG